MFGGLDALLGTLDAPAVGGALGLLSLGIWLIRLQRVAGYLRLGGLLFVLVAGVLVAGGVSGVVNVDAVALARLLDVAGRIVWAAVRVLARAGA